MKRPVLFLHFKLPSPALAKAAKKLIPAGKTIKKLDSTVNKKTNVPEKTQSRKSVHYTINNHL